MDEELSHVTVVKCKLTRTGWRVERIDQDGGIEVTTFFGNKPRSRAYAYARLLNF